MSKCGEALQPLLAALLKRTITTKTELGWRGDPGLLTFVAAPLFAVLRTGKLTPIDDRLSASTGTRHAASAHDIASFGAVDDHHCHHHCVARRRHSAGGRARDHFCGAV